MTGPYANLDALLLPTYVRPGTAMLVLRDVFADDLTIDGLSVGDPKSTPHHYFTGTFRGYFNVPFGPHLLVARLNGKTATLAIDVARNGVIVKRLDWSAGAWLDDEPDTRRHYESLARSGSMLQAKALRPWPFATLIFQNAPDDLKVNGLAVKGPFHAVLNLLPGAYVIATSTWQERLELPSESMQIIDFASSPPTLVDPRMGDIIAKTSLMRAPEGTVTLARSLNGAGLSPALPLTQAIETATANLAIMNSVLGSTSSASFGDRDFSELRSAFDAYIATTDATTLDRYIAVVRRHYILDSEMGKQAPYFARYAEEIARHITIRPELTRTAAGTYFNYLPDDLIDSDSPMLEAKAPLVERALARAKTS